jgi:cell division protein FtsB
MTSSDPSNQISPERAAGRTPDRFRPATDFPKEVSQLQRVELESTYLEMRECLIFTNRSRGQLIRRNEEYRQTSLQLRADVAKLQASIQKLAQEKQQLAASSQDLIQGMEQELMAMGDRLEALSSAFDAVADVETADRMQWSFLTLPQRFLNFLNAVRSIVSWWREEQGIEATPPQPALPSAGRKLTPEEEALDRRENPHLYTDIASIQRESLNR